MSLNGLMSKPPVVVEMDDDLTKIRDIFDLVSFHHLLVVREHKLVGIISDRDYFKAVNTSLGTYSETSRDLLTLNKKAHQIMSRKVVTVSDTASVYDVVDLFNKTRMSCIPVVDKDNVPLGIISWKDIIRILALNMERNIERKQQSL